MCLTVGYSAQGSTTNLQCVDYFAQGSVSSPHFLVTHCGLLCTKRANGNPQFVGYSEMGYTGSPQTAQGPKALHDLRVMLHRGPNVTLVCYSARESDSNPQVAG